MMNFSLNVYLNIQVKFTYFSTHSLAKDAYFNRYSLSTSKDSVRLRTHTLTDIPSRYLKTQFGQGHIP